MWTTIFEAIGCYMFAQEVSKDGTSFKFYRSDGTFDFVYRSHSTIKCHTDYAWYPFDTLECEFAMKSVAQNLTRQV